MKWRFWCITREHITDAIISSVVPKIMDSLEELFDKYFHLKPLIVGPGTKTGISIRADNPKEVGADRIVNVAAAREIYKRSCIVIDFGTATTFDYVSAEGVFQYTVIMPGLEISARALSGNTAKLPQVEIIKPDSILASNTVNRGPRADSARRTPRRPGQRLTGTGTRIPPRSPLPAPLKHPTPQASDLFKHPTPSSIRHPSRRSR